MSMTTNTTLAQRFPLDVRVCLVIFLASVFLFIDSRELPDKAVLFPSIMLVCIMGLSLYCIAASFIKRHKASRTTAESAKAEKPNALVDLKAVCAFAVMSIAYAFFTPYLGFGLCSLVFIAAGTIFFGERDKRAIVAVPLGTLVFVYAFFIYFLGVGIPFFPEFLIAQ